MTYSEKLYEHLRKCADLKHEYTEVPTQFIHDLLDRIDALKEDGDRLMKGYIIYGASKECRYCHKYEIGLVNGISHEDTCPITLHNQLKKG